MSLTTLLLMIGAIALALTAIIGGVLKAQKSWVMTYLQNFCGALFVFSGWVKAIDPLGTGYKMQQYFAEFESTFEATWLSFIAPLFPLLSEYATAFSVVVIIFEIVLGIMLIIGARPKFTKWAFFLLVAFFTFLTGFTYLTGYVPSGVNFFEFSNWAAYDENNMKVTDCGCFGDFIKLKPKTSFFKDVFLLFPAIFFLLGSKNMHQIFTKNIRSIIIGVSTVLLGIYCFSNFVWDLPHTDFRPFAVDRNILLRKTAEEMAGGNQQVIGYTLTNKANGEVVDINMAEFMKRYAEFPKEAWEYEQIKAEAALLPADLVELKEMGDISWIDEYKITNADGSVIYKIPTGTKVGEFDITAPDGTLVSEDLLMNEGYSFMIVAYKLPHEDGGIKKISYQDTAFISKTVTTEDTSYTVKEVGSITVKERKEDSYIFPDSYKQRYTEVVNPILDAAQKDGHKIYAFAGQAGTSLIDDFRHSTQSAYPFYEADDILLKTIVRSNPGVVLMKNGKVVEKWHHKKLPSYEEIKAKYLK